MHAKNHNLLHAKSKSKSKSELKTMARETYQSKYADLAC